MRGATTCRCSSGSNHTVSPYLVVSDAPRLIAFLEATFDARELNRHADGGRIVHAEVLIGDSIVMIGDKGDGKQRPASIQVFVDDTDATYQRALAAGATSESAPEDQSYGSRSAGVVDHAGNQWWFGTRWS